MFIPLSSHHEPFIRRDPVILRHPVGPQFARRRNGGAASIRLQAPSCETKGGVLIVVIGEWLNV